MPMQKCFTCGTEFQNGPHQYDGRYIPIYNISVCNICYEGNWDGWTPDYGEKIIDHLENVGLSIPEMNEKGLLPRD